jgi:hypothetical protein
LFRDVYRAKGVRIGLGFWNPTLPVRQRRHQPSFFLLQITRGEPAPLPSILFSSSCGSAIQGVAAGGGGEGFPQRSQRQRHRSSSPPDREGRRLWRRRERHEGQWPRRRWEAALLGVGRGGHGGDPAGVQEDGAEPQGDPRRPLGGRDLHHAPRLRHGPRRRRREAYLPRYTPEPSLRRPFTLQVPTVLARISWPGARHPTLGFE